jgi:hypothetical protein
MKGVRARAVRVTDREHVDFVFTRQFPDEVVQDGDAPVVFIRAKAGGD